MKTFPVMFKLEGRPVVVIGGGAVGLRKVCALLDAGASVRLVAGQSPPAQPPAGVELLAEDYRPEHLGGAVLVFACTDDRSTNTQIAADARRAGIPVNTADQPEDCDFYLPATTRRGDVVLAVGTGGASPHLAGQLRDQLADALPEKIGKFAAFLAKIRKKLHAEGYDSEKRKAFMKKLSTMDGYEVFRQNGDKIFPPQATPPDDPLTKTEDNTTETD
jgi:siroheme synthase-like protein